MIDLSQKTQSTFAAYGIDSHRCAIEPISDECGQPFVVFHIADKGSVPTTSEHRPSHGAGSPGRWGNRAGLDD